MLRNRKIVIVGALALFGIVGALNLDIQGLKQSYNRYQVRSQLKDVYSEYNLLVKNRRYGAPVPQSRLDSLSLKASALRVQLVQM